MLVKFLLNYKIKSNIALQLTITFLLLFNSKLLVIKIEIPVRSFKSK